MGLINDLLGSPRRRRKKGDTRNWDVYDGNGHYLDTARAHSATRAVRIVFERRHGHKPKKHEMRGVLKYYALRPR